jgi:uncharacterized membrane protein HdeD (DUF308 family)
MVRLWWISVIRGLIAFALAVAALATANARGRLITFLAVYWLVGALLTMRLVLTARMQPTQARLSLAAGLAGILTGLAVLLRSPLLRLAGDAPAVSLLAAGALLVGTLRVVGGFATQIRAGHHWQASDVILGAVEILLGVTLLIGGGAHRTLLTIVVAGWGAASGTLLIALGLTLRRLAHNAAAARSTPPPGEGATS